MFDLIINLINLQTLIYFAIIQVKQNQVFTTNPFIYCNVLSAAAPIFKQIIFFCKSTK